MDPAHQDELGKVIPKEDVVEYTKLTGEYDGVIVVDTDIHTLRKIINEIRARGIVEKTVTFISWK